MRLSVRPSVRSSIHSSVRPSVRNVFFLNAQKRVFSTSEIDKGRGGVEVTRGCLKTLVFDRAMRTMAESHVTIAEEVGMKRRGRIYNRVSGLVLLQVVKSKQASEQE